MYKSLIPWCKQIITVERPSDEYLPTGESMPGVQFEVKGLVVDDTKLITDKNGQLYQCRAYAYVIPSTKVLETDRIKLPHEKDFMEIKRLGGYYDGNDGQLSVQVVYL